MPSIDVVVPCYNYAQFLPTCVRSILAQRGVELRVLIINDASPDDTREVADRLAAEDSRISVIHHAVNRGNINTYNEGIDWATSNYFLLISADDYLVPNALARAVTLMEKHPEVVFVHGNVAIARQDGVYPALEPDHIETRFEVISGQSFIDQACRESDYNPVWTPTAIVRTSFQKSVGKYSTVLPHAGDLHLWLRLACYGAVARIHNQQAVYRRHDSNMHHGYAKLKNLQQHLLAFDSVFEEYGEKIEDRDALQKKYKQHLAMSAVRLAQREIMSNESAGYLDYTSFARRLAPEVSRTPDWMILRALHLIGPRAASVLKTLLIFPVRTLRRSIRALKGATEVLTLALGSTGKGSGN